MFASFRPRPARCSAIALLLSCACVAAGTPEYSPEDRLVIAAGQGDLAAVNALLGEGLNVNYQARPGASALTEAIAKGSLPVVNALLAAKADPDVGRRDGQSPLYDAISRKQWAMVPPLLAAKANPDFADSIGKTPLFLAAEAGRQDIVKMLVAAGADPSPRTTVGGGRSALFWVTDFDPDMALLLVKSGANVNTTTDYQDTPLRHASAGNTSKHLELVRALLAAGAATETGQSPRDKVDDPCSAAQPGEVCVKGTRNAEGTALGIAVRSGSVEIVQALLAAGANVNTKQSGWQTPLMIAAAGSRPEGRANVVRMLLAAGADARITDRDGNTALMLALKNGNREIAEILQSAPAPAKK